MDMLLDALTTVVCSFLTLEETVIVLSQVLRRPDLKVPWSHLLLDEPESCAAARKLAHLTHVETLSAYVTAESVADVRHLAQAAKRVSFCLVTSKMFARLSTGLVYERVTSLSLGLLSGLKFDCPLTQFFASFPCLVSLDLRLGGQPNTAPMLAALLGLRSLRSLVINLKVPTVDIWSVETQLLRVITYLPDLVDLCLDLWSIGDMPLLRNLETLSLVVSTASAVQCLPDMTSLRRLALEIQDDELDAHGAQTQLHLPGGLREFSCQCGFSPSVCFGASRLVTLDLCAKSLISALKHAPQALDDLESLTTEVRLTDVGPLLKLLPTLRRLERLSLASEHHARIACDESGWTCSSVRVLTLKGRVGEVDWLRQAFPNLAELEFNVPASAHTLIFRVLPRLQKLVNQADDDAVIIGRRGDGKLVRRWRDQTSVLD